MPWPMKPTPTKPMRSAIGVLSVGDLLCRHVIAELDRVGDRLQGLEACADAAHQNVAVSEHAAEHRLVDVDALDLVHVHLDGFAANEALFVDDATIGDRD